MAIENGHFWVVDVEGNGGTPPEIIELAAVEIRDFAITDRFRQWLVRPSKPIQPMAARLHGLKDVDVALAPTIDLVEPEFRDLVGDLPIAGHNVRVEVDILARSFKAYRPPAAIDTLRLARIQRPGLASYSLESLTGGLPDIRIAQERGTRGHHSALYDACAAALLLLDLIGATPQRQRVSMLHDADLFYQPQASLL